MWSISNKHWWLWLRVCWVSSSLLRISQSILETGILFSSCRILDRSWRVRLAPEDSSHFARRCQWPVKSEKKRPRRQMLPLEPTIFCDSLYISLWSYSSNNHFRSLLELFNLWSLHILDVFWKNIWLLSYSL